MRDGSASTAGGGGPTRRLMLGALLLASATLWFSGVLTGGAGGFTAPDGPPRATNAPSMPTRRSSALPPASTALMGSTPSPTSKGRESLVNGVILFLHGGRWKSFFLRECLPRLDAYLLRCYPYPLHVFHEDAPQKELRDIEHAAPHAGKVVFEDVSHVWKTLPDGVSETSLQRWMKEGVQPHFAGRGYRVMCRFWAGVVWTLQSMDAYDYYWRLDTDSVLTHPVRVDPFAYVFREKGCDYGYNKLKGENMLVATGIYDAFEKWAAGAEAEGVLSTSARERVRTFALHPTTGKYWGPMFFNNFEMGSIAMKRSDVYQSFFRFIDSHEPFGIFRYRWGDAPIHSLGVVAALEESRRCNVSSDIVGYRHAPKRVDPIAGTCHRRPAP